MSCLSFLMPVLLLSSFLLSLVFNVFFKFQIVPGQEQFLNAMVYLAQDEAKSYCCAMHCYPAPDLDWGPWGWALPARVGRGTPRRWGGPHAPRLGLKGAPRRLGPDLDLVLCACASLRRGPAPPAESAAESLRRGAALCCVHVSEQMMASG